MLATLLLKMVDDLALWSVIPEENHHIDNDLVSSHDSERPDLLDQKKTRWQVWSHSLTETDSGFVEDSCE